ncbi:MAG: CapA family protein [Treponema sp.]|jgi:poly-gamma-glutamate synthesis protein (capsule biosynthesis protein)|nr:CapA family protein [Treponema sp.]
MKREKKHAMIFFMDLKQRAWPLSGMFLLCALGLVLGASCTSSNPQDYLKFMDAPVLEHSPENPFLQELLKQVKQQALWKSLEPLGIRILGEAARTPDIYLDFYASWEYEGRYGDVPIAKTFFVPQADPLARRKDTSLTACLRGEETLVPLAYLKPPFVALTVDGRSLRDPAYPLVKVLGMRIRPASSPSKHAAEAARLARKIRFLQNYLQALPKPLMEQPPEICWIAAAGDMMLGRGASEILAQEGPQGILGKTAALCADADISLVNLEGPVSNRGTKARKSYTFRFDPQVAPLLQDAGIKGVLLANNHAFDYGLEAFLDSLNYLAAHRIPCLGAGLDAQRAAQPLRFSKGPTSVRVFGLASFPREKNGWDGLMVAAGIDTPGILHAGKGGTEQLKRGLAQDGALDVLLFHGGEEWSSSPTIETRELYTDLIRSGVDLVIGSHPHVVQGFEWVLGKPVFWSLGNYVFGGMDNTEGGDEGLFIRLGFKGTTLVYFEPYALRLSHTRTDLAPEENLDSFYRRSQDLRDRPPQDLQGRVFFKE